MMETRRAVHTVCFRTGHVESLKSAMNGRSGMWGRVKLIESMMSGDSSFASHKLQIRRVCLLIATCLLFLVEPVGPMSGFLITGL